MCLACEMAYLIALEDGIPPSTGTASHVDTRAGDASRFVCDTPEPALSSAQSVPDGRKPVVKSRE
jgi:hypothetical protein